MRYKKATLRKVLIKSGVVTPQMLTGLVDAGYNKFDGADILNILHESDEENFLHNYAEALSNSAISVRDYVMTAQLREIVDTSEYCPEDVVKTLIVSCTSADTFKSCGEFLGSYCSDMEETQALECMTAGKCSVIICTVCNIWSNLNFVKHSHGVSLRF